MVTRTRDRDGATGRVRFVFGVLGLVLGLAGGIAWAGGIGTRLDTMAETISELKKEVGEVATRAEVHQVAEELEAHQADQVIHESGDHKVDRIVEWHTRLSAPLLKELAAMDARNAADHQDIMEEIRALRR